MNGQILEQVYFLLWLLIALLRSRLSIIRLLKNRSLFYICAGQYVIVTILIIGLCYIVDDMFDFVSCIEVSSSINQYINSFRPNFGLAVVLLIIILYCILIIRVRLRIKTLEAVGTENKAAKSVLQLQLKLMSMFRNAL